jgi:hypothetical protein
MLPGSIAVAPAPAATSSPTYTLGKNMQGGVQLEFGPVSQNPNGAIVTITSSDPTRVLLSRSLSTLGTASINVAVPARESYTQLFYVQALEGEGEVRLRLLSGDTTREAATISLAPSWFGCATQGSTLLSFRPGQSHEATCSVRTMSPTSTPAGFRTLTLRPGLNDAPVRIWSTAPDVFTANSEPSDQSGIYRVILRAIAFGQGELRIEQPPGFGPVPDGSDVLPMQVLRAVLTSTCGTERAIEKDTQFTCSIAAAAGVNVTGVSENPALLLVSADPRTAGAFMLQALASSGTAELVFRAPGYQDLRIAVALRPTRMTLEGSSGVITLKNGAGANLSVALSGPARAGANITADLTATPAGIVAFEPARIKFEAGQQSVPVRIRATASGSTVIRLSAPEGISVSGTPIAVSVTQ